MKGLRIAGIAAGLAVVVVCCGAVFQGMVRDWRSFSGPADVPAQPAPPPDAPELAVVAVSSGLESLADLGLPVTPVDPAGVVAGSRFGWAVPEVAVTDTLTADQREALAVVSASVEGDRPHQVQDQWIRLDGPLMAGSGREFLLALVQEVGSRENRDRVAVALAVQVDGEPPRTIEGRHDPHLEQWIVVVAVPSGADAVLELTDRPEPDESGREVEVRSVSLRTGEPVGEPHRPADLLGSGLVRLTDAVRVGEQGDFVSCAVEILPRSFDPDRGYAPPGRMWLEVTVDVTFLTGTVVRGVTAEVDLAGSVTLVGEDGEPLPLDLAPGEARPRDPGRPQSLGIGRTTVVEVPDTWRSFPVTFRLRATFTAQDGSGEIPYQRFDSENDGTIALTTVDLPGGR